ncbi:MAG: dihydropteroate synthase [Chloroflexi bacterium]|nr:dihydropteroate synthase [Chloroflexota bacterium]
MIVIGECIHVISSKVKDAIEHRDTKFIQELAQRQVAAGANVLDLNIGPQKRRGPEVMEWMVDAIQDVCDVTLSLDTTNVAAIEAGLERCRQKPFVNSTDATPERLSAMMPLAAKYNANLIALTLAAQGLPSTADARIELAVEHILPAAAQYEIPMENLYFDPLVMTVNGMQDQALQTINAMRFFKQMSDPPPMTTCGLSNISNGAPPEVRPLINRVFLVMMMAAGMDSAILDPLDEEMMNTIRTVETRQCPDAKAKLYLALYDAYAASEELDTSWVDIADPQLRDIIKTIAILENKTIYAHSYLRV